MHHTCLLSSTARKFIRAAVGVEIIGDYDFLMHIFLYFYTVYNKWVVLNLLFSLDYSP